VIVFCENIAMINPILDIAPMPSQAALNHVLYFTLS